MRKIIVPSLLFTVWVAASMAYADTPAINVCVSDDAGRVAFKDVAHVGTPFVTPNLSPGNYVVQFSTSARLNAYQYLLVVSAGKTKVIANSVPAEKFRRGGVAMKVKVGPGLKIMGQVACTLVSDISFEKMRQWQDHAGEGSPRNHFAGRRSLMVGQTGRGY
jgi:hypothetical protein